MRKSLRRREAEAPEKNSLETLAKLHAASRDFLAHDQQATIAALEAQALRYETAIDKISQGVCFFDGERAADPGNRRYAEIYKLKLEDVNPGTSCAKSPNAAPASEPVPWSVEDYLAWSDEVNSDPDAKNLTIELKDGRTIHIFHQPMPDGGWVATHEDITELKAKRAVANERISLQALIDFVPDYLWVKDTESRFIVANKALTIDNGRKDTSELIGQSDFDFHAPEIASEFRADELEILRSGKPMIDKEEYVIEAAGHHQVAARPPRCRCAMRTMKSSVSSASPATSPNASAPTTLRDGQAQILEMIALNAPLGEVLDRLMRLVESQLDRHLRLRPAA